MPGGIGIRTILIDLCSSLHYIVRLKLRKPSFEGLIRKKTRKPPGVGTLRQLNQLLHYVSFDARWHQDFGSHCALKNGRCLQRVGVTLSGVQGALDLFLAQPFMRRYEVPREDRKDRHRTKDGAGKVECAGRHRVEERGDRDLCNDPQSPHQYTKRNDEDVMNAPQR